MQHYNTTKQDPRNAQFYFDIIESDGMLAAVVYEDEPPNPNARVLMRSEPQRCDKDDLIELICWRFHLLGYRGLEFGQLWSRTNPTSEGKTERYVLSRASAFSDHWNEFPHFEHNVPPVLERA